MPARGPFVLTSSAQVSASGSMISVRQLVFSWALMATFPYVRRISIGLRTSLCTAWTNSSTGLARISRSCDDMGVRYEEGRPTTLSTRANCFLWLRSVLAEYHKPSQRSLTKPAGARSSQTEAATWSPTACRTWAMHILRNNGAVGVISSSGVAPGSSGLTA